MDVGRAHGIVSIFLNYLLLVESRRVRVIVLSCVPSAPVDRQLCIDSHRDIALLKFSGSQNNNDRSRNVRKRFVGDKDVT